MSDSEYYNEDCDEIPVALQVQKPKKRVYSKRSESEEVSIAHEVQKPKKRVYSKRSESEETSIAQEEHKLKKRAHSKRSCDKKVDTVDGGAYDLFGLVSKEDENTAAEQYQDDQLPAVLMSRVANGTISRRKKRDGEFYVDIKVYKTSDAVSTRPEERWKKALTSLKLQMNPDSSEWKQLQAFFNTTRELMKGTKSIFFANKAF